MMDHALMEEAVRISGSGEIPLKIFRKNITGACENGMEA